MNARNQVLVVVTALMLVCSAMAIGAAGTLSAVDEHEDDADDYDDTEVDDDDKRDEPTDEAPADEEPIDLDERDDQPVLIVVDELTVEQLNVENVYVLVIGEDVDLEALEEMLEGIEEEPTEEVPVEEEPVDDDPVHDDDAVDDEPVDDDPVHDDDPVEDEPVDDDPVDDGPVDDEPVESFTVDILEAPETAAAGEMITVTATVTNPADEQSTQDVQFRLEGDLIESQEVTLEAGETDDVVFDIDTTGLAPGEFVHMVLTDEFGQVTFIELTEEVDDEPVDDEPVDDEPVDDEDPIDDDEPDDDPVDDDPIDNGEDDTNDALLAVIG